jgi:Ribosomal protein S3, C-terminal domain
MGQKINPKIFRLGIKQTQWDSRYFEKKKEESTLYNYQNIEIQSYLKQFLFLNGLLLQKTKFYLNDSNLYIHISYFTTKKTFFLITKKRPHKNLKFKKYVPKNKRPFSFLKRVKRLSSSKNIKKPKSTRLYRYRTRWTSPILGSSKIIGRSNKKLSGIVLANRSKTILESRYFLDLPMLNSRKTRSSLKNKPRGKEKIPWYKKTPWYIKKKKEKNQFQIERLGILNSYKTFLQHQKYKSKEVLKKNVFLEQLLEGLSLFINQKHNVFLTFQNLNRGMAIQLSQAEQDFLKKRVLALKRYSKEKFFKESLNVMLIVIKAKNSVKLFAQFIAQQLRFLKRHNYFLTFLRRIVTVFLSCKTSKVRGIKICISGRFNRAPRAKSRIILVGDMPIQTISKQIDYHEATSYTKNGTFGIKLWVNCD